MSTLYNETLLNQMIDDNNEAIQNIVTQVKKVFPNFIILANLPGATKRYVIYQHFPLDITIIIPQAPSYKEILYLTYMIDDCDTLYLETLENLKEISFYECPNLAILLDSKLIFSSDNEFQNIFYLLKQNTIDFLEEPISNEKIERAFKYITKAEHQFSICLTKDDYTNVRKASAIFLEHLTNALQMINNSYWHYNFSFQTQELESLKQKPKNLLILMDNIMNAQTAYDIQIEMKNLMFEIYKLFQLISDSKKSPLNQEKAKANYDYFEKLFYIGRIRIKSARLFPENKQLMYFTLLDISNQLDEHFSEVFENNLMTIWNPKDFYIIVNDFELLFQKYKTQYERIISAL